MPENAGNAPLPDQWEFVEPSSGHVDAGLPEARPAGLAEQTGAAEVFVVALLAAAVAFQLAWLLSSRTESLGLTVPARLLPQVLASASVVTAVLITVGVMVLKRRARTAGLCATVAVGALLCAAVSNYNPRAYTPALAQKQPWLSLLSLICAAAAAVLAGVRLARSAPGSPADSPARAAACRIRAVVLGIGLAGVALFAVGVCLAAYGLKAPMVAGPTAGAVATCCSFGQSDGYKQTTDVLVPVLLAACVVLAAGSSSRARSVAWLAAPAALLGDRVVQYLALFLWPDQSYVGIGGPDKLPGLTIVPEPGFWLVAAGLAVLGLTAVLRARIAVPGADPYGPPAAPAASTPSAAVPPPSPPASAASA
jgi:hypothetical protein